ncbi:DUF2894 domain-containing protein [Xanthomonas graminis]|uniref:DUF2894 domain-containing protein n=1 Tax=Xanthomonas graminis pv. graminis TaxID=134874 RepID=A0A1M4J5A9_9XANT|nr:DUF2894 domain-containing protein [Xanthomonas translucens]EKU26258.1 hypothetical protein XTG29_00593 [Xanthomonas translucens pv. graminis ART-Xtg29]OAX58980.1 hypothetical protein A6R72_03450 [Xanthomonas translucens pv. graminis]UKE53728.1 DUF2894 domain-containing protein [Xanthomonas translucens pv. graminis]WIH08044.1 DUF2894 domain-containing protein [Xanthomonas translucens pv. graminis]WIH13200.1 DUF2894 domain-containing protein [Xanthomonas translucens pv. graminis]
MRDNATSASELLGTWRQQHAERLDPLRLRFIEALARRADAHQGEARRLLEQKLSALLDAYAADLARMSAATAADADGATATATDGDGDGAVACGDSDSDAAPTASASARSPLGDLLQRFASGATHDAHAAANAMPPQPAQLPALDDARRLWTELRSRSQLRQSLQQAPADAGPLNSGVLVHRALALMRSLSPGYLQQFLAYVDALSWLQQLHDAGALATPHKPDAAIGKKPTRGKPRKRG